MPTTPIDTWKEICTSEGLRPILFVHIPLYPPHPSYDISIEGTTVYDGDYTVTNLIPRIDPQTYRRQWAILLPRDFTVMPPVM